MSVTTFLLGKSAFVCEHLVYLWWGLFCISRTTQAALSFAFKGMDLSVPTSFGSLCNQVNSSGIGMRTQMISVLLALLQDITSFWNSLPQLLLSLPHFKDEKCDIFGVIHVAGNCLELQLQLFIKGFLDSSKVPGLWHCLRWSCSQCSALEFHCHRGQLPCGVLSLGSTVFERLT